MKNLLAVFIGIILSLILLGSGEIFFQLNDRYHWIAPLSPPAPEWTSVSEEKESRRLFEKYSSNPVFKWQPPAAEEDDENLYAEGKDSAHYKKMPCCIGRRPLVTDVDLVSELKTAKTGTVLFKAHYTVDSLGRRVTPKPKNPKYNVLAFGDSFTYGVGVNNEETYPYLLGQLRPGAQVYNMGLGAGSPAQALYELNEDQVRLKDVAPRKTILFYSYNDTHMERLFCRSLCLKPENTWMLALPFYERVDDKITFRGFYDTDRPYLNALYSWISKSALLEYFHIVWPTRFSQEHYDFFADLMLEQEKSATALFPQSEFYLVLHPGGSAQYGPLLKVAAQARGIKVLDYSGLDMQIATGNRQSIPGDRHPSPVSQFIFAQLLNRDLPH